MNFACYEIFTFFSAAECEHLRHFFLIKNSVLINLQNFLKPSLWGPTEQRSVMYGYDYPSSILKRWGEKSNTETVPVYRMEKIISDMLKYKQAIWQLILLAAQEKEISLKLTFTRNTYLLFFFSLSSHVAFGFVSGVLLHCLRDDRFKNNSGQEKCSWEVVQLTPLPAHPPLQLLQTYNNRQTQSGNTHWTGSSSSVPENKNRY